MPALYFKCLLLDVDILLKIGFVQVGLCLLYCWDYEWGNQWNWNSSCMWYGSWKLIKRGLIQHYPTHDYSNHCTKARS